MSLLMLLSGGSGGGLSPLNLSDKGSPAALYTVIRPSNYMGKAIRVIRTSDSAESDIDYSTVTNVIDWDAADAFAPGGYNINTLYDVSGNDEHLVVNSTNYIGQRTDTVNGIRGLVCSQCSFVNTTLSIAERRNSCVVFMGRLWAGFTTNYWAYGHPTAGVFGAVSSSTGINFTNVQTSTRGPITTPSLLINNYNGASAGLFEQNGSTLTNSALTSGSETGFRLGSSDGLSSGRYNALALAVYDTTISDTIRDAWYSQGQAYGIRPTTSKDGVLALYGDSITYGQFPSGSSVDISWAYKLQAATARSFEFINLGVPGEGAAACAAGIATRQKLGYIEGISRHIAHVAYGTNDLRDNVDPSTIYSNIQTICTGLYAQGFDKVIVATQLPWLTSAGLTNGQTVAGYETDRQTLIGLIQAGEGTDYDVINDVGSTSDLGNDAAYSAYTYDSVHPNDAGYTLYAGYTNTVLEALTVGVVPEKVEAVSSSGDAGSVTLSITPPFDNFSSITSYAIRYRLQGSGTWDYSTTTSSSNPTITDNIVEDSTYEFQVAAVNSAGAGAYSDTVTQQASAFNYNTPAGLQLWLEAWDSGTITESGGNVTAWTDKSGNGYSFTASGTEPDTGTVTIDSKNFINFSGTNEYLKNQSSGLLAELNGDVTVFVVHKADSTSTDQRLFNGSSAISSGFTRFSIELEYGTGPNLVGSLNPTFTEVKKSVTANTNLNIAMIRKTGSTLEVYMNGGTPASGAAANWSAAADLAIGASVSGASDYDGSIGLILLYDTSLSAATVNAIGAKIVEDLPSASWVNIT